MLAATEVDVRLFGMLAALVVILVGFHILSGGRLISPANMVTLAVQASGTAIMATGMVLIIVSRNIDLSVGSQVGVIAMVYAVLMTDFLPNVLGVPRWAARSCGSSRSRSGSGSASSSAEFQGFIIAYVGVPSFVVTLGGLLALRGDVWVLSEGASVTGIDKTFRQVGGGVPGSLGGEVTWVLAILGVRRHRRHTSSTTAGSGAIRLPVAADVGGGPRRHPRLRGHPRPRPGSPTRTSTPRASRTRIAEARGIESRRGRLRIPMGISWPIILLIGVGIVMTFIATRRRFGRYVYAYGGNPEAADLAGINTRWTIMKTFIVMGVLCAVAGAIVVGRLNGAAQDLGIDRGALRHRRGGRRRHLVRGRHRHHPRRRSSAPSSCGAVVRPGVHGRALSGPEPSWPASSSWSPWASTRTTAVAAAAEADAR